MWFTAERGLGRLDDADAAYYGVYVSQGDQAAKKWVKEENAKRAKQLEQQGDVARRQHVEQKAENLGNSPIAIVIAVIFLAGFVFFIYVSYRKEMKKMKEIAEKEAEEEFLRIDKRKQRLAHILASEKDVANDPRAVAIFGKLREIDAGFRISFPDNLAASLSQILVNIEILQRSGKYPAFTECVQTIFDLYKETFQIGQTHMNEFRLVGGGFGLTGAATGIMMAEAVNALSEMRTQARVEELVAQINILVSEANTQIDMLRQVME